MSCEDFVVAIPTYQRPNKLIHQTLTLLIEKYQLDEDQVYLFLENEEQYKLYYDTLQLSKFRKYEPTYVITNTKGIGAKRNYIRNYFPDNTNVVMMDDDIEKIWVMDTDGPRTSNRKIELEDFYQFVLDSFYIAEKENVSMWGVCLFDNAYFMSSQYSTNLKYLGGTLQGIIVNEVSKNISVDIDQFEDYEFSIKHFIAEKKCLRFNHIGLSSKYYSEDGGICANSGGLDRRMEEAYENATYLLLEYPDFLNIYNKSDGTVNIKLNHLKRI